MSVTTNCVCSCLFIPMFYLLCCPCEQNIRDYLYCDSEKDVGGVLCQGHILHLVHLKTMILTD